MKFIIAIAILLFAVILRGYLFVNQPQIKLPRSEQITFEFVVKTEPKVGDKSQVIKVGDALIFAPIFPKYSYGDRLRVSGKVNENGNIFRPQIDKIGQSNALYAQVQNIRGLIAGRMQVLLPRKEAALLVGSVLGVDDMGAEFKDQLIKTGTIHVVVVSGQNLAIVAGVFVAFASYLGRRRAMLLASVAVIFYAALTGFAPPVMRACIMVIVASAAVLFGREANAIWSLLIAALLIVFLWPQAIGEISFQLTFAASLGIVTLGKTLANLGSGPVSFFLPASALRLCRMRAVGSPSKTATRITSRATPLLMAIVNSAAVAISAYLFTAPIIFFYFGQFSLIAPIANILVAEAVAPIMAIGFVVALSSLIFTPLSQLLAYFALIPAFYFVKVVEFCASLPFAQIEFGKGEWWLVVLWYFVVLSLTAGLSLRSGKAGVAIIENE